MKIIKRYANRRLYDSDTSRTITLDEVAQFVKDGEEIKVLDNITKEDITSKVLGQTFLKMHEPKNNEQLINFILTALIRESSQGGFMNMIKKLVFAGIGMTQVDPSERDSIMQALGKLEDATSGSDQTLTSLADKGQKQAEKLRDTVMDGFNEVAEKFQNLLLTSIEPLERSERLEGITRQVDEFAKNMMGLLGGENESAPEAAPKPAAPKKKAAPKKASASGGTKKKTAKTASKTTKKKTTAKAKTKKKG